MQGPAIQQAFFAELGMGFVASGGPDEMPVARFAPVIRHVFDYWCRHAKSGETPSRQDIDPIDLSMALPNVALWDVAGGRYTCRLAGTRVCDVAGREVRGLSTEEVLPDHPQVARAEFALVCRTRHLHYVERPMSRASKSYKSYARLLLPLSADGKSVNMLLAVLDFRSA
jgi:hypothetical protein